MKTIIIGGGAAGCFAAMRSAMLGDRVTLIEKNPILGKKLRITGKGRCNLTNACDTKTLLDNIPHNGKFLYSAFSVWSPQDTMEFFEKLGVALKVERGNRVFPCSDKAMEIVVAIERQMQALGVTVVHDTAVELVHEDGVCFGVIGQHEKYYGDKILLACGGAVYPLTGSDGDSYTLAKQVGHTIVPIRPSLVPIETVERDCIELMGLSLKNVRLTLKRGKKVMYSELGEMLFTHFGVSGPLVLSASAYMDYEGDSPRIGEYTLSIDLKPALTGEQLDKRILREIEQHPNKELVSLLRRLLPSGMVAPFLGRCGLPPHRKSNAITRQDRLCIARELKEFSLTVRGLRPLAEGIITRGGIAIGEVAPKTMESRLCKGLYPIGEALDVDGLTGGFNLQIAFSTAELAVRA